jgi:hypothetical protein
MVVAAAGAAASAQPLNDNCGSAEAISGFGVHNFDNSLATTDGMNNDLCLFFSQAGISNDIWYCWTATSTGPVRMTTCSQTPIDTKIAVYDGCTCPEGNGILACSDDNCGLQTAVSWTAMAGQTYLLRLGNYPGAAGGPGTFTIESAIVHGPVTSGGSTYFLLSPMSWTQGEAAAVAMGGHLATVNDAAENEFLRSQVLGFDGADRRGWIGLNDVKSEGMFVWVSGQPVGYTNWAPGEPNNSSAGGLPENYVEMFGSSGGWNDTVVLPPFQLFPMVEIGGGAPACYANCDQSTALPFLNINDYVCFQQAFAAGNSYANCDGSTAMPNLNVNDFVCFQQRFAAGCSAP